MDDGAMSPFWRRRRREAELDEEIRAHLAMSAREHESRGESPKEAAYAARREFGNATLVKEVTRQMWAAAWLDSLVQDLRLALQSLRRTPAFTLTVVALLGLGLGGAAGMYGILERLLLRAPEHVSDPDGLYSPYVTASDFRGAEVTSGTMQWRDYRLLTDGVEAVSAAAAFTEPNRQVVNVGTAQVEAQKVMASASYFDVLGVRPAVGRFFLPEDSAGSAPPVTVIGYGFWRRQFGGARDVLGKTIAQGGVVYTIIGVAPRGFSGATPERVDVWLPAQHAARATFGADWEVNNFTWQVVARARPGRSPAQAVAEGLIRLRAAPLDPRYQFGGVYKAVRARSIVPGRVPGATTGLRLTYIVGGAAALVALIALANAVVLLLLRALRRRRETAMRLVLGIARSRLVRAVAIESALLAALAGGAASIVATVGGELLRRLVLRVDWAAPVVDPQVALLTLGVSLGVGFVAGMVPGWLAGRSETVAALKSGMRQTGARRAPARAALLTLQAGLSLTLLAGLALYLRSVQRARAFDFGPDVDHVLVAELQDRTPGWFSRRIGTELTDAVLARVGRLRGVQAAALSSSTPLWSFNMTSVKAQGVDSFPGHGLHGPYVQEVGRDYFAATGLAMLGGRYFADQGPGGPPETVVSQAMAHLWRNGDAIGRCLYLGRDPAPCTRIVGVVSDLRMDLRDPAPALICYVPLSQSANGFGARSLIVRAADPSRLVPGVREIVATIARVRQPEAVRTLRDVVDPQYRRLRQGMALFGIFAGLAVVVAMIGMYSVVAYSVTQRAHEFGIRVALGARATNLVRLVLGQALGYATAGLLLGLVLAVLGGRYLAPLLYQTSPRDPLALCAAASVLVVAALVACIVPARAAARADPRQALQAE